MENEEGGRTGSGERERERETEELHHPELARIPSSLRTLRCVSAHQCTWHPSEFSCPPSLSLSLLVGPSLFLLASSSRLFAVLVWPGRASFLRSNLALALSARFLFSSYSSPPLAELTHPFLTLCTVYRVSAEYLSDIDSDRRRGRLDSRRALLPARRTRTELLLCDPLSQWPPPLAGGERERIRDLTRLPGIPPRNRLVTGFSPLLTIPGARRARGTRPTERPPRIPRPTTR